MFPGARSGPAEASPCYSWACDWCLLSAGPVTLGVWGGEAVAVGGGVTVRADLAGVSMEGWPM